jgi:hypothetical protein
MPRDERAEDALHPNPLAIPTLDPSADSRQRPDRGVPGKSSRDHRNVLGVHPVLERGVPVLFTPAEQFVGIGTELRKSARLVDNAEDE